MSSRSTAIGKSRGKEVAGKSGQSSGAMAGDSRVAKKHGRPSDRLNPKTVDPFKDNWKPKSGFESVYVSGGLPCRLVHGSVKHKLQWDSDPEGLEFDPLLVTLAETSTKQSVYEGALSALAQLSSAVGPHLCPHLKSFLSYLSKGLMDKRYKDQIYSTLQHIEQTCGKTNFGCQINIL
ncbi:putative PACRG-like protein [Apostichopus japonicus]|uniref:Putative PACRG-like protein n=1 Tax=Stichopus japonicus TaxID=307972 RepID=A0A2G8K4D5_STIJA|nr:putative PACRG-like protein [Apostichopus japonicus]